MLLDVINAKWEEVLPAGFIGAGVLASVYFGRALSLAGARGRIRRFAVVATVVLTIWSYAALAVALVTHGSSLGATLSTLIFGTFVAVILALICFVVLWALLWIGSISAGRSREIDTARSLYRTLDDSSASKEPWEQFNR
jgi:hypothetical protein